MKIEMAFDRSVRTVDQDGRMHVAMSPISKATVNPYYGAEIPRAEQLGLIPDQIYHLLRDPEELAKAAPTFNNVPLMIKHVAVTASDPQKELVVGSTGTDAVFEAPYLMNSLVIWDDIAIAGITTKEQTELSCSYHYDADMTPGEYEGVKYDGVMRNIRGNHVALVEEGRAGPDVYVFDSQLPEQQIMKRNALHFAVRAAVAAHVVPKLAADAKLGDLGPVVVIKKATLAADSKAIVEKVIAGAKGKLAKDMDIDPGELGQIIELAAASVTDEDDVTVAGDDDKAAQVIAMLKDLSPEDTAKVREALGSATDETPTEPDDDKVTKSAMDAAVKSAANDAIERMRAIREAEKVVAPHIGEVAAMDSAEAIYKLALDHVGVDVAGVHPSAYRSIVAMLPKPGDAPAPKRLASDSASSDAEFKKQFPEAFIPGRA